MDFTVVRCIVCNRVKWFYKPDKYESDWKENLPNEVTVEHFEPAVCNNQQCIDQSIREAIASRPELAGKSVTKIGDIVEIPRASIRRFEDQPRKFFDEKKLYALADSIKAFGQLVPVMVKKLESENGSAPRYELIDGERRWRACSIAGITTMKANVMEVKDAEEQFNISVIANFGEPHDPVEIAYAIGRLRKNGQGTTQIKKFFSRSDSWVYQHERILDLDERVIVMMSMETPEEERLVFSSGVALADLPKDRQLPMATEIVKGNLKHGQAKSFIRETASRLGMRIKDSHRRPRSDYRVLQNFVKRTQREVDILLRIPQDSLDKMFTFREPQERDTLICETKKNIEALQKLLGILENVKK